MSDSIFKMRPSGRMFQEPLATSYKNHWAELTRISSLEAGQDYNELPNVIAISILNYDFPPLKEVHTCFHLREDRHRDYVLSESLEIHYLNMVQYRKQWKGRLDDPLSRWLAWLNKDKGKKYPSKQPHLDKKRKAVSKQGIYYSKLKVFPSNQQIKR